MSASRLLGTSSVLRRNATIQILDYCPEMAMRSNREKLARARCPDDNVDCPGKREILFAIVYKIFWGVHSGSILNNISPLQIHLHPLITYQLN